MGCHTACMGWRSAAWCDTHVNNLGQPADRPAEGLLEAADDAWLVVAGYRVRLTHESNEDKRNALLQARLIPLLPHACTALVHFTACASASGLTLAGIAAAGSCENARVGR